MTTHRKGTSPKKPKNTPKPPAPKCEFCSLPKPCGCPGFDHQGWG